MYLMSYRLSAPSIDHTALSKDPLLTQPSIDSAAPSVNGSGAGRTNWNGSGCAFYHCFNCLSVLVISELHVWL